MSGEDGWLQALADWTTATLDDAAWHVYTGGWPEGHATPAVMWRWTGAETKTAGAAGGEETRRYAGHVLAQDAAMQSQTAALLADELGAAVKLPLDVQERRYLVVRQAAADLTADAMTSGQLSLTLGRKRERQPETAPLMREVSFRQKER